MKQAYGISKIQQRSFMVKKILLALTIFSLSIISYAQESFTDELREKSDWE
jgi:hypothetical protein